MNRRVSNASRPDAVRSKDVLFEIGTEELPATMLADIAENPVLSSETNKKETVFEVRARKAFEAGRVAYQDLVVYFTPRRIVFWFKGVAKEQLPKDIMTKLLAKQEAYAENGEPTEKLLTILKHRGVTLQDTVVSDLNGKPHVFIKKSEIIRKTEAVIPEIFQGLVKSFAFPKNMRWGLKWEDGSDLYFPRPIRSFLCLYGEKHLKFKIAGLKTENKTFLFSKGGRKGYLVKNVAAYFTLLKNLGVILDSSERKKEILAQLEKLAKSLKGHLYEDPFLLNEVNFLVECPLALAAPFGEEFLSLPLEVLTVSMARKQRIFGVVNKDGAVVPKFLAVLDGEATEKEKKQIAGNIENILHAKLQDSLFFYKEDTKLKLEKKREELKGLVFLKGAGSMLEKTERLVSLAKKIGPELGFSHEAQTMLERACFLAKADLLTQMVGEFPELQGVMGKYYALENGEAQETASAVGEQYLPRTAQDKLPDASAGSILSILDKVDLITASFALGNEPTSSLDPYGLRRSATAVIKITLDKKLSYSFSGILEASKSALGNYLPKDKETAVTKKIEAFFKDRFKALLADRGYREDLLDAVLASRFENFYETYFRVDALSRVYGSGHFSQALKVVERTVNILKGVKEALPSAVDASLFTEDLEREVFQSYERSARSILDAQDARDYPRATSLYAEAFFDILNRFFEKVFVNSEDLRVRKNRLTLLRSIRDLYTEKIADLSIIKSI